MDILVLLLILGKSFPAFIIKYDVSCGVFVDAFYPIEEVPFESRFVTCFYHEGVWDTVSFVGVFCFGLFFVLLWWVFGVCFFAVIKMITWFLFFILSI